MPAYAAWKRLVDYYQSPDFADDVVGHIGQDPKKSKIYRQHIVDRLNRMLDCKGIVVSDILMQDQERFVRGNMPQPDLIFLARLYALQGTERVPHEAKG